LKNSLNPFKCNIFELPHSSHKNVVKGRVVSS
jgi:hypothetical protein